MEAKQRLGEGKEGFPEEVTLKQGEFMDAAVTAPPSGRQEG